MNSAVKEAHRLVDEAASHIASLKTILDHDSLPPIARFIGRGAAV
jgi:hypothetical protein